MKEKELSHFNKNGRVRMVDVGGKEDTQRIAIAEGSVVMQPETLKMIKDRKLAKGDVLAVAQVAGIMAAKKTYQIIPMSHPLLLTNVDLNFTINENENKIIIQSKVKTIGKTGVELEALTAVAAAGLTIYDMCKAVDRGMIIQSIYLLEKSGGESGHFLRAPKKGDGINR
ncbi:MAG TPA: cyclic pyranopterin monophosphate synthase MoaC [Candidatus Atribacteria bacterium]|nr:cyclic pyranopterin monophosphate synthase MoaC [Candidatus Atribacteria bacterium]